MIAVNSGICPNFKIYLYPNVPRRRRGETTVDNATTTEGMVLQDTTMPPVNDRLGPGVTCAVPDREQLDKVQSNILANPSVGLIFMVPGFDDTLRVNGRAVITRDPDLLALLAVKDRLPLTAIAVHVEEVFLHCAKAFRRSKLWDPAERQDRSEMPSLVKIILDQIDAAPEDPEEMRKLDEGLEESYRKSMY